MLTNFASSLSVVIKISHPTLVVAFGLLTILYLFYLKNSVKSDHCSRSSNPRTAMNNDRSLLRTHSITERSHKSKSYDQINASHLNVNQRYKREFQVC